MPKFFGSNGCGKVRFERGFPLRKVDANLLGEERVFYNHNVKPPPYRI